MSYAQKKRQDMMDHLELEERFYPLNVRQPSWWVRHSEEFGLALWIVACTLAGVMLVFTMDHIEGWFR